MAGRHGYGPSTGTANCVHDHAQGARRAPHQRQVSRFASGLKFMSAQRMTLELRKTSAGARRTEGARIARQLGLAAGLIVLAIPLSGCGTGALWDKFMAKDDTFVEEPADKLYNEGLYLMNNKKDPKAASKKFEEVDRQHPYSCLLYTSDAADDLLCVDLGGRRIIK